MDPPREVHLLSAYGARLGRTTTPKVSTGLSAVAMSYTISKDNTAGDSFLQDSLLGEWGQKNCLPALRTVTPSKTSSFDFGGGGGGGGGRGTPGVNTRTFHFSTGSDSRGFSFSNADDIYAEFMRSGPTKGAGEGMEDIDGLFKPSLPDEEREIERESALRAMERQKREHTATTEIEGEHSIRINTASRRNMGSNSKGQYSVDDATMDWRQRRGHSTPPPFRPARPAGNYEEAKVYQQRPIRQPSLDRSVSSVDSYDTYEAADSRGYHGNDDRAGLGLDSSRGSHYSSPYGRAGDESYGSPEAFPSPQQPSVMPRMAPAIDIELAPTSRANAKREHEIGIFRPVLKQPESHPFNRSRDYYEPVLPPPISQYASYTEAGSPLTDVERPNTFRNEYARPPPALTRAQTFRPMAETDPGRGSRSRLQRQDSDDSDSDIDIRITPRRRRRNAVEYYDQPRSSRYNVSGPRAVPTGVPPPGSYYRDESPTRAYNETEVFYDGDRFVTTEPPRRF
ncbi:DnaJ domain-containing protein [Colletotrichum truncatum]|uniref:DnaJ domain-containing protein n=1 Tax=Colletotrichum truncatum TaxID=5467 RepID=A0ACC3YER1_COLTU|nr:DnaJ domain-containing protein [Colletotrichum truncatum]KAF6783248.1 DnaJ domain-containing protein [Colletotrichum truncatum]